MWVPYSLLHGGCQNPWGGTNIPREFGMGVPSSRGCQIPYDTGSRIGPAHTIIGGSSPHIRATLSTSCPPIFRGDRLILWAHCVDTLSVWVLQDSISPLIELSAFPAWKVQSIPSMEGSELRAFPAWKVQSSEHSLAAWLPALNSWLLIQSCRLCKSQYIGVMGKVI